MDINTHHAGDIGRILKSVQVGQVSSSSRLGFCLKHCQDELVHLKSSLLDIGSGKDDKRMQRQCHFYDLFLFILQFTSRLCSLKSIIDRAEMDLKSKAEAVLSSTFSDNLTGQNYTACLRASALFACII